MSAPGGHHPLGLFDAVGIELEYMIVDRRTLDVRPACDELFRRVTGAEVSDVEPDGEHGVIAWSNELVMHVVELKTQRPAQSLDGLLDPFQEHVRRINALLEPLDCRLLPTGMHPWMDPYLETRIWPHEHGDIYRTYDRIFDCRGHGWSNLQSTHINLPFADDVQFGRLHAAVRLVLPLLPALAASSPVVDGRLAARADHRMQVYCHNADRVPLMAGRIVPEPAYTRAAYEQQVLLPLYDALRPLDPGGILHHEFANARGAIARFDRGAIEIRVLDIQECPLADLAIAGLVIEVIRALVEERWTSFARQAAADTEALHGVLLGTIRDGERARVSATDLLEAFGWGGPGMTAGDIWRALLEQVLPVDAPWCSALDRMVSAGTLATRITRALGPDPTRDAMRGVYAELADCLQEGRLFRVA